MSQSGSVLRWEETERITIEIGFTELPSSKYDEEYSWEHFPIFVQVEKK